MNVRNSDRNDLKIVFTDSFKQKVNWSYQICAIRYQKACLLSISLRQSPIKQTNAFSIKIKQYEVKRVFGKVFYIKSKWSDQTIKH